MSIKFIDNYPFVCDEIICEDKIINPVGTQSKDLFLINHWEIKSPVNCKFISSVVSFKAIDEIAEKINDVVMNNIELIADYDKYGSPATKIKFLGIKNKTWYKELIIKYFSFLGSFEYKYMNDLSRLAEPNPTPRQVYRAIDEYRKSLDGYLGDPTKKYSSTKTKIKENYKLFGKILISRGCYFNIGKKRIILNSAEAIIQYSKFVNACEYGKNVDINNKKDYKKYCSLWLYSDEEILKNPALKDVAKLLSKTTLFPYNN